MTRTLLIGFSIAAAMFASMTAAVADNDLDIRTHLLQQVQTDEDETLFLRCCWARGRAGFHYCEEYGFCEANPEGVCKGIGAAQGRSLDCAQDPAKIPDQS